MDGIECSGTKSIDELLPLIRDGNNEQVISILENYNISDSVDSSKANLLLYSAGWGNEKVTQYLIDQGYHVNAQDLTGTTPLMVAVRGLHEEVIKILLAAGADIIMLNNENQSALHMTCEEHELRGRTKKRIINELSNKFSTSEEIAQQLITAGCHLYLAAYLKNARVLEYMLERGFAVDSTHPITKLTALHVSFSLEDVDSVRLLIKYGANVNSLDCYDASPVSYLYHYNEEHTCEKIELLQILLNLKVSLTSCSSDGYFQISPSLMKGNHKAIRAILQENIDFRAKDQLSGGTVLHHLAVNKNPKVVEELKLHLDKFDVNIVDNNGLNPLPEALKYANTEMVKFLLKQGASPNCAHNLRGYTPLYYAYSGLNAGHPDSTIECIKLLLKHHADPQFIATNLKGKQITVFDIALMRKNSSSLQPVLAHLALLEGLGIPITKVTSTKLDLYPSLRRYFSDCQAILRKNISGTVTIFKLLTENIKKVTNYSRNKDVVSKVKRYRSNFLYHEILRKRFSRGVKCRRLQDKANKFIAKIFEDRLDRRSLVADTIINYLSNKNLRTLKQLSKL